MTCSQEHKDLDEAILVGSEEVFDHFCEPCSSTQHREAVGYCQECFQFLCKVCIGYHGKFPSLKTHTVLEKSAMPKNQTRLDRQPDDELIQNCPKHPNNVLTHFCKFHSQLCCSACSIEDHGSCSSIAYVPDVSAGIAQSKVYKNLVADLDRLFRAITKRHQNTYYPSKSNEKYYSKALGDMKVFRKQINELLDELEEDTERKFTNLHQDNTIAIRSESEMFLSLLSEVKSMTVGVVEKEKAGDKNQLFVQVMMCRQRIAVIDNMVKGKSKYQVTHYSFHQEQNIEQIMSALSDIWSLSVKLENMPTKAGYVREVNVKVEEDDKECNITGIAVLSDACAVVTDYNNKAVKLFDMKTNKLISRLSLSSAPCDITKMSSTQLAMALSHEQKIDIITVSNLLAPSHTIQTPGAVAAGLCYDGINFIIACQLTGSIKIMDMTGQTLNTFSTDSHGKSLFTKPRYIALSRGKDVVYITDRDANTVTSMALSGHVISVYGHDKLKDPVGVAIGKDDTVYVCSRDTDTVHQLTPTGDITQTLLGRDQRLVHCPKAIAYSDDDDVLYISSSNTAPANLNNIRLYQLE